MANVKLKDVANVKLKAVANVIFAKCANKLCKSAHSVKPEIDQRFI